MSVICDILTPPGHVKYNTLTVIWPNPENSTLVKFYFAVLFRSYSSKVLRSDYENVKIFLLEIQLKIQFNCINSWDDNYMDIRYFKCMME